MDNHMVHLLDCAKVNFLNVIKGFDNNTAKWIRYKSAKIENGRVFFTFTHSQMSLTFTVPSSLAMNLENEDFLLDAGDIYDFFRCAKYDFLEVR